MPLLSSTVELVVGVSVETLASKTRVNALLARTTRVCSCNAANLHSACTRHSIRNQQSGAAGAIVGAEVAARGMTAPASAPSPKRNDGRAAYLPDNLPLSRCILPMMSAEVLDRFRRRAIKGVEPRLGEPVPELRRPWMATKRGQVALIAVADLNLSS